MNPVAQYEAAARRGGAWLAGRLDHNGLLPRTLGLHACHKGVWALAASGQIAAAHRLLQGIREHLMCQPGEFYPRGEGHDDGWRSYYAAIVLVGAARLGRFDVASPAAADRLCAYQHPSGGFFGLIDEANSLIDLCVTAQCGWACLALGRYESARRAADFIAQALKLQPDRDHRLYFKVDARTGQLATEVPPNQQIQYLLDTTRAKQHFFYAGISGGFLADLGMLTGCSRYVEAARGYLDFDLRTNPDGFRWPSKCKVGWGAGLLYRATGEDKYRTLAQRVADITWCEAQQSDGSWQGLQFPIADDLSGVEVSPEEITAEFTYELMEVVGALD